MIAATLNRTLKSFALCDRGRRIYPALLRAAPTLGQVRHAERARDPLNLGGLEIIHEDGVGLYPIADQWAASRDKPMWNYMVAAERPA